MVRHDLPGAGLSHQDLRELRAHDSTRQGGSRWNAQHDGRIDELALWKKVLSAPERAEYFNGGNGTTYPF